MLSIFLDTSNKKSSLFISHKYSQILSIFDLFLDIQIISYFLLFT